MSAYNKAYYYHGNFEWYSYEQSPVDRSLFSGKSNFRDKVLGSDREDRVSSKKEQAPEKPVAKRQDHARRASMVFRRLVRANFSRSFNPLLVTVTYAENIKDLRSAYKDFSAYIQRLRYRYGKNFRYIAVPEFQKRGAVHFHALFWGLPASELVSETATGYYANLSPTLTEHWGFGIVFLKPTDGHEKLSSYLGKYMSKAILDSRLRNQKAFVASRNCLRPQVFAGIDSMDILMSQFVPVDILPCKDREYPTQWLGKGRYRLYKFEETT